MINISHPFSVAEITPVYDGFDAVTGTVATKVATFRTAEAAFKHAALLQADLGYLHGEYEYGFYENGRRIREKLTAAQVAADEIPF